MSKMLAVTIGIGKGWEEVASVAADRMAEMTKLDTLVITKDPYSLHHPSWLKTRIWSEIPEEFDSILVFDADILPMRQWNPFAIFHATKRPFIIVPDLHTPHVEDECNMFKIPFPGIYSNGGLFICGREHEKILNSVYMNRYPECGRNIEQTGLNLELIESKTEVLRLPRTFNTILWQNHDDFSTSALQARPEVNLHAALVRDPKKVRQIQHSCWNN